MKNMSDPTNALDEFARLNKPGGKKIITRIKGGLGNQLFCYAAARRLALVNNAELVIDDVTGFVRDYQYRRRYMLDHFCITARKAMPSERLEPFERYRRSVVKWLSRRKPFAERRYLEQERWDSDEWLLMLKAKDALYLVSREGVKFFLQRLSYTTGAKFEDIELPYNGAISNVDASGTIDGVMFRLESWTRL